MSKVIIKKPLTEKDCLNEIEDTCRSILYYKNDESDLKRKWQKIQCALEELNRLRKIKQDIKEEKERQKAAEAYGRKRGKQ